MSGLVVHPHFHGRRTGVTRHVESVIPELARSMEAAVVGYGLERGIPRIGWGQLLRRVRREPVIWHAHRNVEAAVGLLLRWAAPTMRVVYTRHAATPPSRYTRWLMDKVDRRVALTPEIALTLGRPADVVSHGVSLKTFHPPAKRDAAWRELGLGGKHGIGVLGRVRPAKGQGDFVEAAAPLLHRYPDWTGAVVGKVKAGEARWVAGLRARAGGRLRFIPEQSDVLPWYRGLSILVHPSHSEGFSLVHLEALASGCCVVASALPYVPSLIEHGRTGFLYPPGDVGALTEVLEPLLQEPERAEAVGRAAAEAARPKLGLEQEAASLASVYRSVLDPHP
ncbi:MAG TPA: glycosyltransferase family 4 protein [Myxococcaceae bacterium]|nr:glycosyltransferase family 4 protein [Myxococcaceae bacterium]